MALSSWGSRGGSEPCALGAIILSPRLAFHSRDFVEDLSFCKEVADIQAGGRRFY